MWKMLLSIRKLYVGEERIEEKMSGVWGGKDGG